MPGLDLKTIVLATRNPGKEREFRSLLSSTGSRILTLEDIGLDMEIPETGNSFAENARLKATGYSQWIKFPVLADDSGLEVAALQGRPGIHSARYAGPGASDAERIQKLLEELEKTGRSREARFVCALALARDSTLILESEGICEGVIATEPRGTNGFGYDPIFLLPRLGKTYAELTEFEKNLYSHRSLAILPLLSQLQQMQ